MLKHYARPPPTAVRRGEDATRYATIGKLLGSRLQREVADWAVQFHGGMGYMDENWTSRYFRDTRLDSIGAGADEVMLRILARMDGYSVELLTVQPGRVCPFECPPRRVDDPRRSGRRLAPRASARRVSLTDTRLPRAGRLSHRCPPR